MHPHERGDTVNCPDLEQIAAFIDQRLDTRRRAAVEQHLVRCADCYATYAGAVPFRSEAHAASRTAMWLSRTPVIVGGAIAVAAATVLLSIFGFPDAIGSLIGRHPDSIVADLAGAVGERRYVEARLTGGFAYAPMQPATRSAEGLRDDWRVLAAAGRIREATTGRESAEALGALGVAHLVLGERDAAIQTLERATTLEPGRATLLSDLAAAYLARASHQDEPRDLARAANAAERAVRADTDLDEAWFNRALALERLGLRDQARAAWRDYLSHDSSSGWADEARQHVAALGGPTASDLRHRRAGELAEAIARQDTVRISGLVRLDLQSAREQLNDATLPAWADAVATAQGDPAARLHDARLLADAIADAGGDRLAVDAVQVVERAYQGGADRPILDRLAAGHRAYRDGRALYASTRMAESTDAFTIARTALLDAGSPFAAWPAFYLSVSAFYGGKLDEAERILDRVEATAVQKRSAALEGYVHWMRGLLRFVGGRPGEALDYYNAAIGSFERAGEVDGVATAHSLIAEVYTLLSDEDVAWRHRHLALVSLSTDPRRRQAVLTSAAASALEDGLSDVAANFQDTALDYARQWGNPTAIAEAWLHRAPISRALGGTARARTDVENAQSSLALVTDADLAARLKAEILTWNSELMAGREPAEVVARLSDALAFFQQAGFETRAFPIHLARARAHLAAARIPEAEADYRAGIALFERQRAAIAPSDLRISFLEQGAPLFDEMIELQVRRRNRPDIALAYAEQSRARDLRDSLGAESAVETGQMHNHVPKNTALVYYASLNTELFTWVLTPGGMKFVAVNATEAELRQLARHTVTAPAAEGDAARTELYRRLISPLYEALPENGTIVFVPDDTLSEVSFASLRNPSNGRYLIEEHAVATVPSAAVFVQASERLARLARTAPQRALVFGDPRVSSPGPESPPQLREAASEAADIAGLYPSADLFTGVSATKQRFLERAGAYDVIHFAGHAVANGPAPNLSRLLFASDPQHEYAGALFAHEVASMPFGRTRLVVLAACRTAAGPARRGEGVLSLARPFLAAGVPSVVASLWDVDDAASRVLFADFHRALRAGQDAVGALQTAQRALLTHSNPSLRSPRAWAAYTVSSGIVSAARAVE